MKRLLLALAGLALAACGQVEINDEMVFQPPPRPHRAAGVLDLKNQDALVGTRVRHGFIGEGPSRLAYTIVEAGPRDRPLFVHCGGNASDRYRAGVIYASKVLHWGDVIMFDYPGYGDSAGDATAASFAAILEPVAAFATAQARGRPLVFWGHSLGGMVCAGIAGRAPTASGMIFEASARNAREVAQAWKPAVAGSSVQVAVKDSLAAFDSIDTLAPMQGPILILAGARDRTLPVRLSRSLAAAARESRHDVDYVEFADAGHTDIPLAQGFEAAVTAYVAKVRARNHSSISPNAADQGQ